jgi:F0F1-type ATP synthase delta subunit
MIVKPPKKPKVVRRDDNTVHRRGARKSVGVAKSFLTSVIFTLILINPAAVVQTVSLIFNFSWMNAIALVVIIVGGGVIEVILIHIHDSYEWKKIIDYFRDFDDCRFEPTTIETSIELEQGLKKIRDVIPYPPKMIPFLSRFLRPSIRAFYMHECQTVPSELKTYHMAGGTSYIFLPDLPEREWDLRLMSVVATEDLPDVGRNLIIVALVGADLHIRIFDASGNKVIDKVENELISGEILTALKKWLNPFPDESSLSKENKQEIIRNATSIAGHTMVSVKRFLLFHEIGHAIVTNKIIAVQGRFAVVYFCLLFVLVAFHREAGILALLVAFALAAMWAHYWNLTYHLEQQDNMDERLELAADAFALVHLAGRLDFRTTIASIARTFRKKSEFWRYRAWLLVRRAQILSRTGTEFSLGWGGGLSWFEQITVPVPLWLGLLILAGMLWLGVILSIRDLQELLALSLVWVVMPALGHYYRMFLREKLPYTAQARRKALAFLQAHAPEYGLRLMSVVATEDLPDVGRNLIIVALVGADLHIRIFDASGNKVIDKVENELIIDKTMIDLKKRLNPFHDESSLSKEEKQQIIRNAIYNLLWGQSP